jgi:TfoX/Sxy family transcriptional regulator of competence genes
MEWKKAPEELVEFLAQKMLGVKCEYRKMFGYPAYFINGNMFAGIHGENLFIRLSEKDIEKVMKEHLGVGFFEPVSGRKMKGYVVLPKTVYSDDQVFAKLLGQSAEYVSSLLPKQKKKAKF